MLSLSKHEASGAAARPALSFDRLRMRAYFDDSVSLNSRF
jgi:hypothetical protein